MSGWHPFGSEPPPPYTLLMFGDDCAVWIGEWRKVEGYVSHVLDRRERLQPSHWMEISWPDPPLVGGYLSTYRKAVRDAWGQHPMAPP